MRLDREAGAADLRLSTKSVAHTVEFSEDVYVDLDEMGVVVGVELLDLMTPIPMDDLASKHHIHWRAAFTVRQPQGAPAPGFGAGDSPANP